MAVKFYLRQLAFFWCLQPIFYKCKSRHLHTAHLNLCTEAIALLFQCIHLSLLSCHGGGWLGMLLGGNKSVTVKTRKIKKKKIAVHKWWGKSWELPIGVIIQTSTAWWQFGIRCSIAAAWPGCTFKTAQGHMNQLTPIRCRYTIKSRAKIRRNPEV